MGYLEAWEYEKPVIAANIPVMSKIIADREDGLIVPPIPTAIASGIQQLLDNPSWRHELGCRGYRKVRAKYDWPQMMIKMREIYSIH
ncbi:MAG: glycosyltransferase family 4 protein [Acaryochloridaceae cyanobacterium RL_2_7]|nr:glycosyltransferase family 4 protein [Acaryochloridaceae cyanobacterium RL_2_7]